MILDFGLAHELDGRRSRRSRRPATCFGTPAYMSPEQLAAQRIRLDRRTDVWSLGVIALRVPDAPRPFDAPDARGLYQADPDEGARRISARAEPGRSPADLKVVVETALEKDRDRRYQTALDLAEELRRVRMHEPILAKPVGPLVRLQRWAQRNPGSRRRSAGCSRCWRSASRSRSSFSVERDRAQEKALADRKTRSARTAERNEKQRRSHRLRPPRRPLAAAELQAEADKLWPAEPSKVAAMKTWVDQGCRPGEAASRPPGGA